MTTERKVLLEDKLRKMVREELLNSKLSRKKNRLSEEYYRLSKFKFDVNALIDRALEGGNDHSEIIGVLQSILSHRFNQ